MADSFRPQPSSLTRRALRTPRAAAVAGILFAVLFTVSVGLMRFAIPENIVSADAYTWLQTNAGVVRFALMLMPFAGIAFLWFMGVIRDRLGDYEDRFFSTVFFGSGLLFLAMVFCTAAIAGGMVSSYAVDKDALVESGVFTFGRHVIYTITNVYAIRMAGVFMLSLGTIWIRTHVMPRILVFLTFILAIVLLLVINITAWVMLVFPLWVFVISVFILFVSVRGDGEHAK